MNPGNHTSQKTEHSFNTESKMNSSYKEELEILRQRIPVGTRHGLILLEKTGGDPNKAEKLFEEEMMVQIIRKTEVTTEDALRHLKQNSFDIALALKSIDEERYTHTEIIIKKFKDKKEDALDKIMLATEERYHLKREFWLIFDGLKELPPAIYCFLTVMEWLNYESWEGYGSALSFHLEIVGRQFESELKLHELADSLQQAKEIQDSVFTRNNIHEDIQHYITANSQLQNNQEYIRHEEYFLAQRPFIIEKLYEFVKNNITQFP